MSDHLKLIKYLVGVRCIFQLISQILTGPMFIMLATLPEPRSSHIVNEVVESYPDFRFVLPVSECQLRFCDERKFF